MPLKKSRRSKPRLRKRRPVEEEDGDMETDTVMATMVMDADMAPDTDQGPLPRKKAAPDLDQATRRKN